MKARGLWVGTRNASHPRVIFDGPWVDHSTFREWADMEADEADWHAKRDAEALRVALLLPKEAPVWLWLQEIGGLRRLRQAGSEALQAHMGQRAVARLEAVLYLMDRLDALAPLPPELETPEDVLRYLAFRVRSWAVEAFWVIFLEPGGSPIGVAQVALGTLAACVVHPREVFAPAVRARAHAVILVHNHPGRDPEPSPEDRRASVRLSEAGATLGIPVIDHIIVGNDRFRSLGSA